MFVHICTWFEFAYHSISVMKKELVNNLYRIPQEGCTSWSKYTKLGVFVDPFFVILICIMCMTFEKITKSKMIVWELSNSTVSSLFTQTVEGCNYCCILWKSMTLLGCFIDVLSWHLVFFDSAGAFDILMRYFDGYTFIKRLIK